MMMTLAAIPGSYADDSSRATHVPVGDDQCQHLEFARECVTNFNSTYGKHLVPPETLTCKNSYPGRNDPEW